MLVGEVWAARSSSGLTSVGLDSAGSPSPLKSLSAATFTLPQELGIIQESVEVPNSKKTVIHIQDAHCNYAAQKSIAEILNYLITEYGISAVNCEGGAESYDLSPFTTIPEKDIREKTADFFVKEGVVSAAEYYAVNNPRKVNLWGVEDPDLYLKNLKVYRDSLSHKDEVDRYIKSIGYILDNLKRHIYSDELLEFDKYYTGYKENKITFKEYILYLINMAQKRMIDIKSFSNIYLLNQTLEEEDKINFKRANNEKDEVVDKLKKALSRSELEELMVMVGKLKTERISQADFYVYLVKKAKSVKLDISVYSELQKYIIYISLYGVIDRTKITKEIDTLEYRIKTSLYENDTQRELGVLSKNLAITKNIFNISLTRDDYIYYKEHRETFAVANYVSFIDKKAPLYKISAVLDKNIGLLDEYRDGMDRFYECSLERDKAFIKNIRFTDHDRPNSIIITGGFHTENLRELFKNENISYISVMPKFKNEKGYESPYMKRLAGQRTALENVIDTAIPAVLNLQVVEILSTQLSIKVEGRANLAEFKLAVAIVAALIRGEQFIFKIDKEAYPKESKPQEDKIIVFNMGEDGNISFITTLSNEPNFARLASAANATLTAISANNFAFSLPSQAHTAKLSLSPPIVSTIAPAQPQIVHTSTGTAAKEEGKDSEYYSLAVPYVQGTIKELRSNVWTLEIAAAMSEEDKNPTKESGRLDEQTLVDMGYNVHVKRYVVGDKWVDNLKQVISNNMKMISDGLKEPAPRIAIRLMSDKDKTKVNDIKNFIKEQLENNGYSSEDAQNVIDKNVRFIPISIEKEFSHFNAPLDLFVDIGMMEIDRYLNNEYPGEYLPPELKNNFISLLKLSISNFEDFKTDDIKNILNAIFNIDIALKIKRIDWTSVDQWRKSNQALLQSV